MSPCRFAKQLDLWVKQTSQSTKNCSELTKIRLIEAQNMRRCPPSYEWLRTQPVGWVAEVMLAWNALEQKENKLPDGPPPAG